MALTNRRVVVARSLASVADGTSSGSVPSAPPVAAAATAPALDESKRATVDAGRPAGKVRSGGGRKSSSTTAAGALQPTAKEQGNGGGAAGGGGGQGGSSGSVISTNSPATADGSHVDGSHGSSSGTTTRSAGKGMQRSASRYHQQLQTMSSFSVGGGTAASGGLAAVAMVGSARVMDEAMAARIQRATSRRGTSSSIGHGVASSRRGLSSQGRRILVPQKPDTRADMVVNYAVHRVATKFDEIVLFSVLASVPPLPVLPSSSSASDGESSSASADDEAVAKLCATWVEVHKQQLRQDLSDLATRYRALVAEKRVAIQVRVAVNESVEKAIMEVVEALKPSVIVIGCSPKGLLYKRLTGVAKLVYRSAPADCAVHVLSGTTLLKERAAALPSPAQKAKTKKKTTGKTLKKGLEGGAAAATGSLLRREGRERGEGGEVGVARECPVTAAKAAASVVVDALAGVAAGGKFLQATSLSDPKSVVQQQQRQEEEKEPQQKTVQTERGGERLQQQQQQQEVEESECEEELASAAALAAAGVATLAAEASAASAKEVPEAAAAVATAAATGAGAGAELPDSRRPRGLPGRASRASVTVGVSADLGAAAGFRAMRSGMSGGSQAQSQGLAKKVGFLGLVQTLNTWLPLPSSTSWDGVGDGERSRRRQEQQQSSEASGHRAGRRNSLSAEQPAWLLGLSKNSPRQLRLRDRYTLQRQPQPRPQQFEQNEVVAQSAPLPGRLVHRSATAEEDPGVDWVARAAAVWGPLDGAAEVNGRSIRFTSFSAQERGQSVEGSVWECPQIPENEEIARTRDKDDGEGMGGMQDRPGAWDVLGRAQVEPFDDGGELGAAAAATEVQAGATAAAAAAAAELDGKHVAAAPGSAEGKVEDKDVKAGDANGGHDGKVDGGEEDEDGDGDDDDDEGSGRRDSLELLLDQVELVTRIDRPDLMGSVGGKSWDDTLLFRRRAKLVRSAVFAPQSPVKYPWPQGEQQQEGGEATMASEAGEAAVGSLTMRTSTSLEAAAAAAYAGPLPNTLSTKGASNLFLLGAAGVAAKRWKAAAVRSRREQQQLLQQRKNLHGQVFAGNHHDEYHHHPQPLHHRRVSRLQSISGASDLTCLAMSQQSSMLVERRHAAAAAAAAAAVAAVAASSGGPDGAEAGGSSAAALAAALRAVAAGVPAARSSRRRARLDRDGREVQTFRVPQAPGRLHASAANADLDHKLAKFLGPRWGEQLLRELKAEAGRTSRGIGGDDAGSPDAGGAEGKGAGVRQDGGEDDVDGEWSGVVDGGIETVAPAAAASGGAAPPPGSVPHAGGLSPRLKAAVLRAVSFAPSRPSTACGRRTDGQVSSGGGLVPGLPAAAAATAAEGREEEQVEDRQRGGEKEEGSSGAGEERKLEAGDEGSEGDSSEEEGGGWTRTGDDPIRLEELMGIGMRGEGGGLAGSLGRGRSYQFEKATDCIEDGMDSEVLVSGELPATSSPEGSGSGNGAAAMAAAAAGRGGGGGTGSAPDTPARHNWPTFISLRGAGSLEASGGSNSAGARRLGLFRHQADIAASESEAGGPGGAGGEPHVGTFRRLGDRLRKNVLASPSTPGSGSSGGGERAGNWIGSSGSNTNVSGSSSSSSGGSSSGGGSSGWSRPGEGWTAHPAASPGLRQLMFGHLLFGSKSRDGPQKFPSSYSTGSNNNISARGDNKGVKPGDSAAAAAAASSGGSAFTPSQNVRPFPFSELLRATEGFAEARLLGKGGYASVYRGTLGDGSEVAVKLMEASKTDEAKFLGEISLMRDVFHPNVVLLLGYCIEGPHRALVYPLMENGTVEDGLQRPPPLPALLPAAACTAAAADAADTAVGSGAEERCGHGEDGCVSNRGADSKRACVEADCGNGDCESTAAAATATSVSASVQSSEEAGACAAVPVAPGADSAAAAVADVPRTPRVKIAVPTEQVADTADAYSSEGGTAAVDDGVAGADVVARADGGAAAVASASEGGESDGAHIQRDRGSSRAHKCSSSLSSSKRRRHSRFLDWQTRVTLAVGAARALHYLHHECRRQIIHRDMKTANVLIDITWSAKLADFGLAIMGKDKDAMGEEVAVEGTLGYMAPEYFTFGEMSTRVDVYAYGVVLLELITGRKAIDVTRDSHESNLVIWAVPRLERQEFEGTVDRHLTQYDTGGMWRMAAMALMCLREDPEFRPPLDLVAQFLEDDSFGEKRMRRRWLDIIDTTMLDEGMDDDVVDVDDMDKSEGDND